MTYLIIFFRIVTIMALLLIATLLIMGRRPIGEMPVFDFLLIIVLGAVAGADIADPKIEHLPTAFSIVILAIFQRLISILLIKSRKIKKLISFEPIIVVQSGKIIFKNIKKIGYTASDILMLLRENSIFDMDMVEYAIIEPNGNVSIMKKAEYEPITTKQMGLMPQRNNLFIPVVYEGKVQPNNAKRLGLNESNILQLLNQYGHNNFENVFLATMDKDKNINISTYDTIGHIFDI